MYNYATELALRAHDERESHDTHIYLSRDGLWLRVVNQKMGPGWWHLIKDQTDKEHHTWCGLTIIHKNKSGRIVQNPEDDEWDCDFCIERWDAEERRRGNDNTQKQGS